ncbi:DUF928 domain-containing protein [Calothrix sp. UHCC 0171]|uniref:DUF928 domain-containing protein n=1 Tax=Calothrix sp. UHCC 0171 TaxID=3110245 RepID=UPI002B20434F|nr:DUF928 domain-containing protein [Calothrix sp. UHCC 0171]MEA5571478.1 DUF928 domain-containing protein [Calothrix sp. UHCC 0171]
MNHTRLNIQFWTQIANHKILKLLAILPLCTGCTVGYGNQIISFGYEEQIIAQNSTSTPIEFEPPPPPPNRGEPTGRAQGGAGRGCEPTALVPLTKSPNGNFLWGLTVSDRPQFWFSLPRQLTTKDAVEFVFTDNLGKVVYKTKLKNTTTPQGIVNFAIPQEIPPLQIGKTYNWSFSVYCDFQIVEDKPGNVRGSIQRIAVNPTLKNQLASSKSPINQAIIYAKNGIWFDALTTLGVNIRNKKEQNISSAWTELLRQVDLEKIVSLPVTNCCDRQQVKNQK